MFLVPACSCHCPIHWSQLLCREWRCNWSSADRRCSDYIWVINNFLPIKVQLILEVLRYIKIFQSKLLIQFWSQCLKTSTTWQFFFFKSLFRPMTNMKNMKSSALLALCEWNPSLTGGLSSQKVSNVWSISISWCHHAKIFSSAIF